MKLHEDFSRGDELRHGSDRAFGFVLGGFFLLIALAPLWRHGHVRPWAFAAAAPFLLLAVVRPRALHAANVLWARFGALLQRITNPLLLAAVFVFLITPVALLFRLLGRDALKRRRDPAAPSYWIARAPATTRDPDMRRMF